MTCPQCGTENAADARLCRHCGATLPEGPQPVPLRLQHVAASRLCLLTATVSTAGLVLFLLLTLLFPAMQHGFHELAASVGVLLPKDGRLFGGAAFFFFLPSAALCAGLWLAWRAARKEEPVPLTAYRAFRAAAWMEFVLLTVLCLPLHLYLFPFHLPDFARSRVLRGYIGLLVIWAISLVYFCVSRRFLRALGWRTLREKQGTGPCSVMLGINVLLALAMVLGAFSGLFSESLFSGFFPLAFFDGLCRGGGRLLAVLSLLVWAAIRVLLALLLLRLWPLLQKPEMICQNCGVNVVFAPQFFARKRHTISESNDRRNVHGNESHGAAEHPLSAAAGRARLRLRRREKGARGAAWRSVYGNGAGHDIRRKELGAGRAPHAADDAGAGAGEGRADRCGS